jgi:hypothetical protein
VIRSKRERWLDNVLGMGEVKYIYRNSIEKLEGKAVLGRSTCK